MEEKVFEDRIVYLQISSHIGISLGAIHYYGKLHGNREANHTVDVWKRMTRREATKLTKGDSFGFKYRAGNTTRRFETKELLRIHADTLLRKHFPSAVILLEGSWAVYQPQRVLWSEDPVIKDTVNAMYEVCEALGWWDRGNDDLVDKVWSEWKSVWEPFEEKMNEQSTG